MKENRIILFIALVIGSVIFFFALRNATDCRGNGSTTLLCIWGLRRGLHTIGNYLMFIAIVFGVNFLLVNKKDDSR